MTATNENLHPRDISTIAGSLQQMAIVIEHAGKGLEIAVDWGMDHAGAAADALEKLRLADTELHTIIGELEDVAEGR